MPQLSVNLKKIYAFPLIWLVSLETTLNNEPKRGIFRLNHWHFGSKAKFLIAVAIIAILLISVFAFLPRQSVIKGNVLQQSDDNPTATPTANPTVTPTPTTPPENGGPSIQNYGQFPNTVDNAFKAPGLIEPGQPINSAVWMQVAGNAWAYFQPGIGVDSKTGLPYSETGYAGFTDWDLGAYIQAIIDANKTGLIGNNGTWGSSARIDDVLNFLENRTLNAENYPYQFYDPSTGSNSSMSSSEIVDGVDTGRLFVALNNLINFNSSLQQRIDNIVYNGRSNYAALVPSVQTDILTSTNIYSYYCDSGFADFWPNLPSPSTILNNVFSAGNVTTYGNVTLPKALITGDPLLCSVFELNNNNSQLMALSKQVYLANEAYFNATGDYTAFGEGNGPSDIYLWEWVVLPNGDTFEVTRSGNGGDYLNINPIVYNKVAFSFLALYNTTYALDMVAYLEQWLPTPTGGYSDGADNSGTLVPSVGSNTNSLILDAALYALQNSP